MVGAQRLMRYAKRSFVLSRAWVFRDLGYGVCVDVFCGDMVALMQAL
jgi:hypothetical protein